MYEFLFFFINSYLKKKDMIKWTMSMVYELLDK